MIHSLSDKQMVMQLYLTQGLLLAVSILLSLFFFRTVLAPFDHFAWSAEAVIWGCALAGTVLICDMLIMKYAPKSWYDDGGINQRIFRSCSIPHIVFLALLISFTEEILFRGILQHALGLWPAAVVFTLLHTRYLDRPLLFAAVIIASVLLGLIYEWTDNLLAAITAHFFIDFVSAAHIRIEYLKRGGSISDDEPA